MFSYSLDATACGNYSNSPLARTRGGCPQETLVRGGRLALAADCGAADPDRVTARIDRALARIEGTEAQIKTHREATIAPLERELHAMEEEGKVRAALAGSQPPANHENTGKLK